MQVKKDLVQFYYKKKKKKKKKKNNKKHQDNWLPVAYASRSTTNIEQNYSPIELETLNVAFTCEKFHQFIYGKKFIIENDHKPLKQIFQKSILDCLRGDLTWVSALFPLHEKKNYTVGCMKPQVFVGEEKGSGRVGL